MSCCASCRVRKWPKYRGLRYPRNSDADALKQKIAESERIGRFAQHGQVSMPHLSGHIYLVTSEDGQYRLAILGDLELWGVDKVDGSMASIVGQIRCTDSGRWPVQREFNRRMKRRFQERGIEIASAGQTILMQIPVPADVASDSTPQRAAR